ncbi:MAG TPA: multicopper oxidase domain-containing protein [Candidatus Binatia bacterium]|nr:multicopper oxidase domain-containing protein [Candidatus Binatia bacterium]
MPMQPHGGQSPNNSDCNGGAMNAFVTNLHFHGLNVPPVCHQDEVMQTLIQPGEDFEYRVQIPMDSPPGLYWYHPHPHGFSERQVQGGASGALIVEGIGSLYPSLRGVRQRVLVLRDQSPEHAGTGDLSTPAWDISLNYVPVIYPQYQPAVIQTEPAHRELWRVVNAAADTIFDLQVIVGGVPRPLAIVAIDGVPLPPEHGSQWPERTSILLPPGGRAEFLLNTPNSGEPAQLVTRKWDTGPEGDIDPSRPIANIVTSSRSSPEDDVRQSGQPNPIRRVPHSLPSDARPVVERKLYFSQLAPNAGKVGDEPEDVDVSVFYYLTVAGQTPEMYRMNAPPNIVVHQGDVEDWVVENRAQEDHVFHIHQVHFRVLEVDGKRVNDPAMRDTIDLPYWTGSGPYPSVKLRIDFSDPNDVGTFLYHCHILKHEDMGMMGSIQVLPPGIGTGLRLRRAPPPPGSGADLSVVATLQPQGGNRTPTGTVQFMVDGLNAGRPVAISQGRAAFSRFLGDADLHTITAIYSGDSNYDESAAPPLRIRSADR